MNLLKLLARKLLKHELAEMEQKYKLANGLKERYKHELSSRR